MAKGEKREADDGDRASRAVPGVFRARARAHRPRGGPDPAEPTEWSIQDGAFTFGDLVRHLVAAERYMFAENAVGRPSRYPGHGPELAQGYEATMRYFGRMHEEAMEIFRGLTPGDLARRCETPGEASLPVWKWLRSMVEHEVHHRGQIYLMLRVLGVATPPLYGLTSEQVRQRSLPTTPA